MIIAALIIGTLIVMMIKSNIEIAEPFDTGDASSDSTIEYKSGLEKGKTPPDFELSTLTGDMVKLTDYRGKKVILNFWASWCGPCKAEMPHMQKYYEKNKESANVEIIAVNMTTTERGGLTGIKKFVDAYGLTFPIPLDNDGEVVDMYGVLTIPTTYMIGRDGTIQQKIIGPMDEKTINELVDNLD